MKISNIVPAILFIVIIIIVVWNRNTPAASVISTMTPAVVVVAPVEPESAATSSVASSRYYTIHHTQDIAVRNPENAFESSLLDLINSDRTSPLQISNSLEARAKNRATSLCKIGFSHAYVNSVFTESAFSYGGENLAQGYGGDPAAIHAALMASPTHRANIVSSKYQYVGFGHDCDITVELFGGVITD